MEHSTHQNHISFVQGTQQGLHCSLLPRMPVKEDGLESEEEKRIHHFNTQEI